MENQLLPAWGGVWPVYVDTMYAKFILYMVLGILDIPRIL